MIKRQIIIMKAKKETNQIIKFCVKNTHPYQVSKCYLNKRIIRLKLKIPKACTCNGFNPKKIIITKHHCLMKYHDLMTENSSTNAVQMHQQIKTLFSIIEQCGIITTCRAQFSWIA